MAGERLEQLRRRIRNLDAALLGLVAERLELAREVGEVKRAAGVPLRDYEVERRVLERGGEAAAAVGVAPELARALLGPLIEESCRLQEIDHYAAWSGEAESVLVVGGAGRMGRWLARFCATQGHRVVVCDPAAPAGGESVASLEAGLAGATLAFLATPLESTAAALDAVAATGYRGVVCDVASLKGHLRPALERARRAGAAVTSLHPMFGPAVRTLADRVIVVCDCGDPVATERVTALFRGTAATLVALSIERHDRLVAWVLGLSHLANLAFARALAASGLSHAELAAVGSTTFQSQMGTTASVVAESPDLYFAIQRLNPETSAVAGGLARALAEFAGWVEGDDPAAFAAAMRAAHAWVSDGG